MQWRAKSVPQEEVEALARSLCATQALGLNGDPRLASTLARLLVSRGLRDSESATRYLLPSLSHLHSPYRMSGMRAAVGRLQAAIARKEGILIYGDYDVDGTLAIVILKTAIELSGGSADFHVPHRIREGYGMRDDVIERAAAAGIRLIISVDTGIRAFTAAATAERHGVDLIVTDHHLPGPEGAPRALSVLNPQQPGCEYPCKTLCGAGIAFKLAQALMENCIPDKDPNRLLMSFLKLVAIATIADAVPLTDENRVFTKLGLEALRRAVNPGLRALLEVAQVPTTRPPTATEIAFRIAPRLNAAGRMDVARDAIELFSTRDAARAREIAARLDQLNGARQEEERRILTAIEGRFVQDPSLRNAYCVVIDGDGWHRGVIGITASRVVERYRRPTLVVSHDNGEAHGSGRSIKAFHLLDALESCRDLFTRYGGHAHAVGFSLPSENVGELRARLERYARGRLTADDFEPSLDLDAELPLDAVTPDLFRALERLEPYGQGNPEPVFAARAVRLMAPPKILKDKHVKLKLAAALRPSPAPRNERSPEAVLATPRCHPDAAAISPWERRGAVEPVQGPPPTHLDWRKNITFDALGWQMAECLQQANLLAGDTLDIAFTVGHNDHPHYGGLELSLRDFCANALTCSVARKNQS